MGKNTQAWVLPLGAVYPANIRVIPPPTRATSRLQSLAAEHLSEGPAVTGQHDDFWQKRAAEARLAAEGVTHPELKRAWCQVAAQFERLANVRGKRNVLSYGKEIHPPDIQANGQQRVADVKSMKLPPPPNLPSIRTRVR